MTRRFAITVSFMLCALLWTRSAMAAADDVLKLVPEGASGLMVINSPAALDAKVQALAGAMQMPAPSPLMMLKQQFEISEGWDEKGTVGVIMLPPAREGAMPTAILLLPVTDYDKFVQQFNPEKSAGEITEINLFKQPFCARHIGGYAALTMQASRAILEKTLKASTKTPAELATWKKWLADKDAAGIILQPGLKRISARIQAQFEQMKTIMANAPEQMKSMANVFDMYGELFQAVDKEVASVGFGVQVDEQSAVRLTKRVSLAAGGTWAELAAQVKPVKGDLLAGLPAGPFVVAGGGAVPEAMFSKMMTLSLSMMKNMPELYGLSEEQADKMSDLSVDMMKGVRAMSMAWGVGESGDLILANFVTVMRVDDSRAFLEGYEKWIKEYGELLKGINNPMMPAPEVKKVSVKGISALQFTMNMPQLPEDQQPAGHAKMMEAMVGPDGKLVAWIAAADAHSVVMCYDKDRLLAAIDAVKQGKSGLAGDAEVSKVAALLPSNALAVGYISPSGAIEFFQRLTPMMGVPGSDAMPKIPEFPKTAPIGLALTTGPNEVEACMVLPVEVLQAIGAYGMQWWAIPGVPLNAESGEIPPPISLPAKKMPQKSSR